jgi:hypothetical protein
MKTVKAVEPVHGTFVGCCRFEAFSFGSIRIDGVTYEHDVLIDRGQVHKRKKKPSKKFREAFGHTPLSAEETRMAMQCIRKRVWVPLVQRSLNDRLPDVCHLLQRTGALAL